MPDSLAALGLSPLALNFLARRDITTIEALCRVSPRELLWQPAWLTGHERSDRLTTASAVLREVQVRLAERGLSLRGDRFTQWANEPLERLELTPRAASLLRRLRVATVGELLALTFYDLFATSFSPVSVRELMRTLAERGLHLSDGYPRGPEDWA